MYEFQSRRAAGAGAFALSLLLAGCGGSDNHDCQRHCAYCRPCPYGAASGSTAGTSVTGVVAMGRPVAGAQVLALDGTTGATCGSATTGGDGSYTMSLQCTPGPVVLAVNSGLPTTMALDAVAFPAAGTGVTGTVNITPLTTLALYGFVGLQTVLPAAAVAPDNAHVLAAVPLLTQAANAQGGGTATLEDAYNGVVSALLADLGPTLAGYGVPIIGFDPVRTPFTANGAGFDAFLDAYPASLPSPSALVLGAPAAPLIGITLPTADNATTTLQGSALVAAPSM